MRKLFFAAVGYVVLGLAAGFFYREFTKSQGFPEGEYTQLGVAHTHLLALGFLVMLIVIALQASLGLTASRAFGWFFWLYNSGVIVTTGMMLWRGSLKVLGTTPARGLDAAISGTAGLGHISLTAGLVCFLVALGRSLARTGWVAPPARPARSAQSAQSAQRESLPTA